MAVAANPWLFLLPAALDSWACLCGGRAGLGTWGWACRAYEKAQRHPCPRTQQPAGVVVAHMPELGPPTSELAGELGLGSDSRDWMEVRMADTS